MLCDKCKKNAATFFSTVNINGNITETHLCKMCAENNNNFNFNSFFGSAAPQSQSFYDDEPICEKCGYSLSDYVHSGFLGCSNCYTVFRNSVLSGLNKIQPDVKHVGKTLEIMEENNDASKIKKLEIKLKQAVNEENYELASEIKKKIIELKEHENENR